MQENSRTVLISFRKMTLDNGLRVIVHQDRDNPISSLDIHYLVGSRDDRVRHAGMAHLLEHLMFEGTVLFPSYDQVVQNAGGENNAYTTSDTTNYHVTLPSQNLEKVIQLEADRMANIRITAKSFHKEKQVVLEEFKETVLNKPYGDSFHLISSLAYKKHPYRWPTIGFNEKSISNLTLEATRKFYRQFYQPSNAIVSITTNRDYDEIFSLIKKYFGGIKGKSLVKRKYAIEPSQHQLQKLTASRLAPAEAIYMAFHSNCRRSREFYIADVISDLLSNGHSTRLFRNIIRGKKLASNIDAYITGSLDPGLFIIEAKAIPGISIKKIEAAIWEQLNLLKTKPVSSRELTKIKNTIESSLIFSEINGLNKAITLSYFEMLGDANAINSEGELYQSVTSEEILASSRKIFNRKNCNVVYYKKAKEGGGFYEDEEEDD